MTDAPRLSIVPPTLRMSMVHFAHTHRGISVIGTWIKYNGRMQPCMVLAHAARPIRQGRTIPIAIPLDEARRWALHPLVGDETHCEAQAEEWIEDGLLPGNAANDSDIRAVLDAVQSRLRDLYNMPPAPPLDKLVIGEMVALDPKTGRVVFEKEATANV